MPFDLDDPWADDTGGASGSGSGHVLVPAPGPGPAAAVDLDPALVPALDPTPTAAPDTGRTPRSHQAPRPTSPPSTTTRLLTPEPPRPHPLGPVQKPLSRSPSGSSGLAGSRAPSRALSASHPLGRDMGLGDRDRGRGAGRVGVGVGMGGAGDQARDRDDPPRDPDVDTGADTNTHDVGLDSRALNFADPHPLRLTDASLSTLSLSDTDVSDVSRPALRRATTEAQSVADVGREYASSTPSNSESGEGGEEVEVVVHQIKTGESLPGIALRYGIDLAILRKVNKLWPADPIHLRTTLYVPLDACSGDVVRGPGEGQVTLKPKRRRPSTTSRAGAGGSGVNGSRASGSASGSGASGSGTSGNTNANGPNGSPGKAGTNPNGTWRTHSRSSSRDTAVTLKPAAYGENSGSATAPSGSSTSGPSDPSSSAPSSSPSLVLDIVRLPASQLRFFPRARRGRARSSLDARRSLDSRGRTSDDARRPAGLLEQVLNNSSPPSSRVVRLRPPSAPVVDGSSLKGRLVGLFSVPPPPSVSAPLSYHHEDRHSTHAHEGLVAAKGPKGKGKSVKEEIVEMDARAPRRYAAAGASARRPPRVAQIQSASKAKRD